MNQQLQVFNHEQFGDVRIIEEDGKVLFCGKDVAKALGYENPRDAIRRHCRGVVKRDGVSKTTNQHPSCKSGDFHLGQRMGERLF